MGPPGQRTGGGGASLAPSSRNDYDVESMLSARSLPQRQYPSRWDRAAAGGRVTPDCDRLSESAAARILPSPTYSTRAGPAYRRRADDAYERYDHLDEQPPRREYSPMRMETEAADGVFKGFTTPMPGNGTGYLNERRQEVDTRSRRYPAANTNAAIGEPPERLCSTPAGPYTRGYSASSLSMHNDLGGIREPQPPPPQPPPPPSRYGYGGEKSRNPYDDNYSRAALSHYGGEANSACGAATAGRYRRTSVASAASKYRNPEYYQSWDSASGWDGNGLDQAGYGVHLGERALSPRTFKRECQRAYKEARAQRMRNLEEGLYGKCDWATFDSKYC